MAATQIIRGQAIDAVKLRRPVTHMLAVNLGQQATHRRIPQGTDLDRQLAGHDLCRPIDKLDQLENQRRLDLLLPLRHRLRLNVDRQAQRQCEPSHRHGVPDTKLRRKSPEHQNFLLACTNTERSIRIGIPMPSSETNSW